MCGHQRLLDGSPAVEQRRMRGRGGRPAADAALSDVARRRYREVDGLRGVAAMLVVLHHYLWNGPRLYPDLGTRFDLWRHGEQGVRVFFVISGVVIAMSLRRQTVQGFARSRFLRLFPTYWAALIVTGATMTVFGLPGRDVSPFEFVANFTMVQDLVGIPNVDGVYWTLAVELCFYVVAAGLWFTGALKASRLPTTLYVWLAAVVGLAAIVPPDLRSPDRLLENTPWFLLGIAALALVEGDRRRSMLLFPIVALASGAVAQPIDAVAAGLAFAVLVVALVWRPLLLAGRPLVFLGWISYPLYLLHQNLGFILLRALADAGVPQWAAVAAAVVLAVMLAAAFTKYVSEPLTDVGKRVWPAPAGTRA